MDEMLTDDDESSVAGTPFATTHWSVVLAASQGDSSNARCALESLCQTYWYPLYAFVRRQGYQSAEAEDLTQGFFTRLLEKNDLQCVRRERGKFRSFLLASMKHYLINEWNRRRALKRGGGQTKLSLDFQAAETRYRLEPADNRTPEAYYERQWATTVLDRVRQRLRKEFEAKGQAERFQRLEKYLTGERQVESYAESSKQLGMSENAFKMAVSRLRKRFQQSLRDEIAQTVETHAEVDDEIRTLIRSLQ